MTDVLTAEEWEKAMAFVLASKDEDPDPKESKKGMKPGTKKRPPWLKPAKAGVNMGDGGDDWVAKQPPVGKNSTYQEDGPEQTPGQGVNKDGSGPTTTPDKWTPKIGFPTSTGKPSGSMALNEDDTAAGWSSTVGTPQGVQKKMWDVTPGGTSLGTGPSGDSTKYDTLNRAPRSTMADEDLDDDVPDNVSLPDGTFFITNANDVQNCVDKVKNAEQMNPRPTTHPWYGEIKAHIATRASQLGVSNLVPDDWQLSNG